MARRSLSGLPSVRPQRARQRGRVGPFLEATNLKELIRHTFSPLFPAKEGLKVMGRNQIHCARGLFGEAGVQSGKSFRRGKRGCGSRRG